MSNTSKTKKYIQGIAFFLFIVGLPAGSWYYLQAGFNYHKDLMSELDNYGRIPEFSLVDQNGDTLTRERVEGKLMVVNFFNTEETTYPKTMDYLRRMYSQFHDRNDLVFASHALESSSLSISELKTLAKKEELDNPQSMFLKGSDADLVTILSKGYQVPDFSSRSKDNKQLKRSGKLVNVPKDYPYFVLVDESGTIRNYYDINDDESVTRLVEHLALILPRKAEEKAELKRETEK